MARSPSSMPSSMFTSSTLAPPATCCRAMETASSNFPSSTSFANFREPVTFVRSPIMMKLLSGRTTSGSRPLNVVYRERCGRVRGRLSRTVSAMARMCSGVDPQQPPTTFSQPRSAKSPSTPDIWAGANPYTFRRWLAAAVRAVLPRNADERVVFINAWNEWAEGAVLEPTDKFGRSYLLAVRDVLYG